MLAEFIIYTALQLNTKLQHKVPLAAIGIIAAEVMQEQMWSEQLSNGLWHDHLKVSSKPNDD